MSNPVSILESTGHSFSGFHDAIMNDRHDPHKILSQIDDSYRTAIKKQEALEKQLDEVKAARSLAVSDFVHVARVLEQDRMTFVEAGRAVVIDVLSYDDYRINYEAYPITVSPEL